MKRSIRGIPFVAMFALGALSLSIGSASAASATFTNLDCGGQSYNVTLEVGETLTVKTTSAGICNFLGYTSSPGPEVSTTFGAVTGLEAAMPGSAGIAPGWSFVVTALAPGTSQLMVSDGGNSASETFFSITVVPASQSATTSTQAPASETYGVPARVDACPTGWTLTGWEAWARGRTCSLTTTYNPSTGQWSAGTYRDVMSTVNAWNHASK